jgi:Holliday junction resolvase-like predicted endonuclease
MKTGRAGASAERGLKHQLEAQGCLVIRSAGSRGPIDLVAVDGKKVRLIQVKRGKRAGPAERQALQWLAGWLPGSAQVWLYERGGSRGAEWQATRIRGEKP